MAKQPSREEQYRAWQQAQQEARQKEAGRAALMAEIWNRSVTQDPRLPIDSPEPWMHEHFVERVIDKDGRRSAGEILQIGFDSYRTLEEVPDWEIDQRLLQAKEWLYRKARAARLKGESWHGFKVGSAMLGFKERAPHHEAFRVFPGHNIKVLQELRSVCSEPVAIAAAWSEDYVIIGATVVSILRVEDVGNMLNLEPCDNCGVTMAHHPGVSRRARICCAMPPAHEVEFDKLKQPDQQWHDGGLDASHEFTVAEMLKRRQLL